MLPGRPRSLPDVRRHVVAERQAAVASAPPAVTESGVGPFSSNTERRHIVSILWIIIVVVLILALLGFFGRRVW